MFSPPHSLPPLVAFLTTDLVNCLVELPHVAEHLEAIHGPQRQLTKNLNFSSCDLYLPLKMEFDNTARFLYQSSNHLCSFDFRRYYPHNHFCCYINRFLEYSFDCHIEID